jgi:alkanesulfonate monooxygenase SsuD/methylene tetrahydromethanopterin reductase-like flavin-dependent oxidoreductase (luciferase family)
MKEKTTPDLSVVYPMSVDKMANVMSMADAVRHGPFHRLWFGQSLMVDPVAAMHWLLGAGYDIPFGLGVGLIPVRTPFETALAISTLARMTDQRITYGLGVSEPLMVGALHGDPYASPTRAATEFIGAVRAVLGREPGGQLERPEYYHDPVLRLTDVATDSVEIGLGALSPKLATVAGASADALIPWMTPPYRLAQLVDKAAAAADDAGRPAPRTAVCVPIIADSREWATDAFKACALHGSRDHYRKMFVESGITWDPDSPHRTGESLVEANLVLVAGRDLAEGVAAYAAAGADEVFLNPFGIIRRTGSVDRAMALLEGGVLK